MKHSIPNLPPDYQLDILNNITGGNAAMMKRLLETFLSSSASHADSLRQALPLQDYAQASEAAHKLTPQVRHLGLEALSQNFKRIDKEHNALVEEGQWQAIIESSLLQLDAVVEAVTKDLESL